MFDNAELNNNILDDMGDLFKKIRKGELSIKQLQDFVGGRNPFRPHKNYLDAKDALKIMGEDGMILAPYAAFFWRTLPCGTSDGGRVKAKIDLNDFLTNEKYSIIPYTVSELENCAKHNQADSAEWKLIYIMEMNINEQIALLGTVGSHFGDQIPRSRFEDSENHLCNWLHSERMASKGAFQQKPKAGYWLVDLKPIGLGWNQEFQQTLIGHYGASFRRTPLPVFTQAISMFYTLNRSLGNNARSEKFQYKRYCFNETDQGGYPLAAEQILDGHLKISRTGKEYSAKNQGASVCYAMK